MGKMIDMYTLPRIQHPDDPRRCQGSRPLGQCRFLVLEGTNFCPLHGHWAVSRERRKEVFRYKTSVYQSRLDGIVSSKSIKSLKEEIAILRLLVEDHLNDDLEIQTTSILRLVKAISALSVISARVETTLTQYVDNESAVDLAKNALSAVEIFSPANYDKIEDELTALVERLNNLGETVAKLTNYTIPRFSERIKSFITDDKVVNLRNEIGVLRLTIEQTLNSCDTPNKLITKAEALTKLITTVGELVQTTNKLETSFGLLLDKEAAKSFTQEIITIIGTHVTSSDVLSKIADYTLNPDIFKNTVVTQTDELLDLLQPDPIPTDEDD